MIKRLFRIVAINLLVLLLLIVGINLLLVIAYGGYQLVKSEHDDTRGELPNYAGHTWANQHFREHNSLDTEYRSYVGWRRLPFEGETIAIDDEGIRKTVQHPDVSDSSTVVVFLGGSTMWGTGVNNENTIPSIFSELGQGAYRSVNLGEASYRSYQGYLFLKQQMREGLIPDVIISYDGVNELHGFRAELEATSHDREYQIKSVMKGQDTQHALTLSSFFFGPMQAFVDKLKMRKDVQYNYDLSEERTDQVARALLDSWMCTRVLAEAHGSSFIAVLQPHVAVGSPNLKHININPEFLKPYKPLYSRIHELLDSPEYEILQEHFVDLTDSFDGEELFYVDWCHVTPNGNRLITEQLLDEVSERMELN